MRKFVLLINPGNIGYYRFRILANELLLYQGRVLLLTGFLKDKTILTEHKYDGYILRQVIQTGAFFIYFNKK